MSQTPSPAAAPDVFPPVTSDQWTQLVERELKGEPTSSLTTHNREGYRLRPVYGLSDQPPGVDQPPGSAPFRRGPLPVDAVPDAVPHIVLQRHVDTDLAALHEAVMEDVDGGVTGLWIDLRASGITEAIQLESVLAGVDVKTLRRLTLDGSSDGVRRLAMVQGWLLSRATPPAQIALGLRLDPLGTLARDGVLPGSLESALDNLAETVRVCLNDLPAALPITLTSQPIHDAGGSLLHSIGWLLANGAFVLRSLEDRGLPPHQVAPRIELHLPLGRDVFSGIAAVRALRVCWTKLLSACGLTSPPPARVHADCSRTAASPKDPWVNALRNTAQVFAGMLAGADAITCAPWDMPLGLPDSTSRRLARNTHFVLGEEAHLSRIADPTGGSYHVEDLTEELSRASWAALRSIEARGGAADALVSGWIKQRLDSVWEERVQEIQTKKERITGVSAFPNPSEEIPERRPAPRVNPSELDGLRIDPLPLRTDIEAWTTNDTLSKGSR